MGISRRSAVSGRRSAVDCLFGLLLFSGTALLAQNAPVTTAATVGGAVPGNVDVPLTVTGFNDIGAVSLTIDYNYAVLHFTGGTPNPELQSFPIGDLNLNDGYHRLTMGWFGSGVTLADGSAIMTLHFTYISGISTLNWYDSGPSCEYADADYNVLNDIPTADYYINGFVCGLLGDPGTITGSNEVCAGQAGEMYSIDPLENVTGYAWAVPEGAAIITGQNTNAITVDYSENAVPGNVSVYGTNDCGNGPVSELFVTVNALPVANAGDDFSIPYGTSTTLHAASGGTGVYAYHWSPEELLVDPDVQNPLTVMLTTTTLFSLTVTNQETFCQRGDVVIVTITGGPLNANPVAIPGIICQGETSQLFANASGGSEDYGYTWTADPPGSPPWTSNLPNPIVTPDVSTEYTVEVFDGFNTVFASTYVSVLPLPTATISGGDTLCGNETTMLQVDLTGIPPWNFTYSYGSTSVFVYDQQTSPYYIIASDPGDYSITAIEDVNCAGTSYGTAIVRKYPIPATPEITVYFMELISSSCCGNQWYLNDTLIPGATGQTYQVTVSGQYTVIVTMNSCSSEPSEPVDIIVGIDEQNAGSFSYYPNPATGKVNIQISKYVKNNFIVSLYSASGIMIKEFELKDEGNVFSIDISNLAPGLYFLMFSGDGIKSAVGGQQSAVGKLIVK